MNGIIVKAQIWVEEDVDSVLKNLKLKTFGQPHDEVLLKMQRKYKRYKANEDRITIKERLLFLKYYGKTGQAKNYLLPKPKQVVNEVLQSLH